MTDDRKPSAFDADETEALRALGWHHSGGSCPDSSLLMAAEAGVLDERTAVRVRSHVGGCANCRMLIADLVEVLGEDVGPDAGARIRARIPTGQTRRRPPYVLWGAGLVAAAAVAWFVMVPRPSPAPVPETQMARVPPPIPSVFVVDRPSIPPGDFDLTVRGEASKVSLEDQIASALDTADRGDTAGALSALHAIAGKNRASRLAALALGAVQLRGGQNADAVATLERARTLSGDQATADEVGWFFGIALVRTAQTERARGVLEEVCRHAGPRATSACAGVAEIDRHKSAR